MEATKRTISTVEANDGRPATQAPRLELAGEWLVEAGFPVGAQVEVAVVEPGRLVVTRVDLEGPVPTVLPLVWVPVEKLAALEEGVACG